MEYAYLIAAGTMVLGLILGFVLTRLYKRRFERQGEATSAEILAELKAICARRFVHCKIEESMRAAAAPSAPEWQQRWEKAVDSLGVTLHRMPSGAGHDAMKLHEIMPQAMLFTRGQNSGISHNPLESTTNHDIQLTIEAFAQVLEQLAEEHHA